MVFGEADPPLAPRIEVERVALNALGKDAALPPGIFALLGCSLLSAGALRFG
jgi:hypothetical protein